LNWFSAIVVDLLRRIAKRQPERFARTSIAEDDLAKIGKFFTDLANLKKSAAKPPIRLVATGKNAASPEQSAEEMKAKHAALDAAA
jgi:hypothetical protein